MCGIAGICGALDQDHLSASLRRMLEAQRHRGPDDEGICVLPTGEKHSVGLGNRRLMILDLSPLGHQPMVNPDTGDVLVYNGEIYNFPQLRSSLEREGFRFRTRCDTEVLLRAYERWGLQCLDQLRGMYAFGIWDARARTLVLGRDHLGIKPLYYAIGAEGCVFASEVRALLASGLVPFRVDRQALAGYLAYGAVQEPLTILEGVHALGPGSWLVVDDTGRLVSRGTYWSFPQPEAARSEAPLGTLVEEGREALERSVRHHQISDVPVAVFLSSGLDSTAVLGLAAARRQGNLHALTVSFPEDPARDEAPLARETARRLGATYHECVVNSQTALQWTLQALEVMDQPTADGVNTYMVSRAAREHGIVVALSGQGGDEIFGGYRSFRAVPRWLRRLRWARRIPSSWRTALAGLAGRPLPGVVRGKLRDLAHSPPELAGIYFHHRRLLSDEDLAVAGLSPAELELTASFHLGPWDGARCLVAGDPIASVARLESVFYLGNTLLRDGDVFGMANSLEIRVPLLDRDVVEWALRLPGGVLLPPGRPDKFLLREICSQFYDARQLRRAKRGFSPPFALWLLSSLRDVMEGNLKSLQRFDLIQPQGVDRIRERFLREPRTAAWSRVWALTALGHWLTRQAAASPVSGSSSSRRSGLPSQPSPLTPRCGACD